MALGLNEVLTKQNITARRSNVQTDSQLSEFTAEEASIGKRLKPWESPESTLPKKSDQHDGFERELFRIRAQSAVQKAREIVSKNELMIDEIHRRRQSEQGMGMNISQEGPRSLEGLNHLPLELNEQDPVLRLWKRGFWERFSDILS